MTLTYQQQKDFSRGITDDRFLWQWYVSDAEGVNIRKQSRGVFLSNNTASTDVAITTWDNIFWFLNAKTGVNFEVCAFLSDKVRSSTTWAIVYSRTNNTNNDIRNVWIVKSAWNEYGIVITQWYVWRWLYSNNVTSVTENLVTLSGTSDYRPYVYDWWFIYVWWDWKVDVIDVSTTTWIITKTMTMPWVCRGLSMIWDQIFVYSNDWKSWYKMSWDWISPFPTYIQKREDNPVINITNVWNIDYVITGNTWSLDNKYRRLRKSAWFEKVPVAISDFLLYEEQLFNFSPDRTTAIDTASNVIYIPWIKHIYTYGTKKASLQDSLAKEITLPDSAEVTSLYVYENSQLYVGYNKDVWGYENRVATYDLREWYSYWSEWYVTTIAFDWWDIETEKQNNRIIVNYKLGTKTSSPTGTTGIDIYTRTNNTDDRVFDCNTVTDKPTIWDKYLYNWLEYTVKEYRSSTWELICSRNENWPQYDSILRSSWTLTKTFGVWDATITFTNVDNFVYLDTISDATKRKKTITWKWAWYELEVMAVLKSTQKSITPELYSIKTLFGYNDQDVW